MRTPTARHKLRFWPNKRILFVCLSFACLFLIPKSTKYLLGSPYFKKSTSRWCAVFVVWDNLWARTQPNGWRSAVACKRLRYAPCLTLQTLCVALLFILDLHYAEHALLSHVINCAFDQTNAFYLFVCLLLVYSFSPRVQSIPRGPRLLRVWPNILC